MRFASSGGGRDMRIYIGCDDSGFAMKQVIMDLLDNILFQNYPDLQRNLIEPGSMDTRLVF